MNHWDNRFLDLARLISSWSKDPSTKVGAVITDMERRIVSVGFNGFPQGVKDLPERYADRQRKYAMIVHAERNAMLFAQRPLHGCTLYTVPFMPCSQCAAMVIQAGISHVVAPHSENARWLADFSVTAEMFKEAGVYLELQKGEEASELKS